MTTLFSDSTKPVRTGIVFLLIAGAGLLPGISPTHAQYVLIGITVIASIKRVVKGHDRALFTTLIITLLTLFFSVFAALLFFPDQPYLVFTIAPIMSYATAITTVEIAQHVRLRTTIRNITSALVLLSALLFIQIWEGPIFQSSFMFGCMHVLLLVWLLGKALEIRPWVPSIPVGLRILDIGFLFIIVSVFFHTLNLIAPGHPQLDLTQQWGVSIHLTNIGLAFIAIASWHPWSLQFPKATVTRFGFGQDITVAFVPLLVGISGTSTISLLSHAVLGGAALVSTCILLIEMESLQKQLNIANASVRSVSVTDSVTGLPNRYALHQYLHKPIAGATIVDVEGLREVNTTYGFLVGDQVLHEFAHRLASRVANRGWVLRSSGNEFVILWSSRVLDIESRLRSTIAIPFEIEEDQFYLSLFIGSAIDPNLDALALVETAYYMKVYERQAI